MVTGDPTQLDLPKGQPSGLHHARRLLGSVKGIGWIELNLADIVRNHLVTKLLNADEGHEGSSKRTSSVPYTHLPLTTHHPGHT